MKKMDYEKSKPVVKKLETGLITTQRKRGNSIIIDVDETKGFFEEIDREKYLNANKPLK